MLAVERTKDDVFYIKTNEGKFEISFPGELNLHWKYIYEKDNKEKEDTHEFSITKENYFIYSLIDKLYTNLNATDNINLIKDGMIEYHSDGEIYEYSSCLFIKKEKDDTYKIIFRKGQKIIPEDSTNYDVKFSNNYNNNENNEFIEMYDELKSYNPAYHQVHIEEYLYNQKVKRSKKAN